MRGAGKESQAGAGQQEASLIEQHKLEELALKKLVGTTVLDVLISAGQSVIITARRPDGKEVMVSINVPHVRETDGVERVVAEVAK